MRYFSFYRATAKAGSQLTINSIFALYLLSVYRKNGKKSTKMGQSKTNKIGNISTKIEPYVLISKTFLEINLHGSIDMLCLFQNKFIVNSGF